MNILSTRKISATIENIVDSSEKYIILVSPYLKISKTLSERIFSKLEEDIKVYILFGKVDNDFNEYKKIKNHKNVGIYFLDSLHAKVFGNEATLLLTSMNLHSFSETNNWELGIEIENSVNEFIELNREIKMMFDAAVIKYGLQKFEIEDDRVQNEKWIKELSIRFPQISVNKNNTYGFFDDVSYSFTYKIKDIEQLLFTFESNRMVVDSKDCVYSKKCYEYFISQNFKSGLRVYEKRDGFNIYPKEGINSKLSSMSFDEFKSTWNIIIEDTIKIFKMKSTI